MNIYLLTLISGHDQQSTNQPPKMLDYEIHNKFIVKVSFGLRLRLDMTLIPICLFVFY